MLTKNAKMLLSTPSSFIGSTSGSSKYIVPITDVWNNERYAYTPSSFSNSNNGSGSIFPFDAITKMYTHATGPGTPSYGYWIGTGTTPPTENDIVLEAPFSNNAALFNVVQDLHTWEIDDGYLIHKIKVTFTNKSSSEVSFSEIGIVTSLATTTSMNGTGSQARPHLVERSVLSSPVTLAAGESVQFEYTITIEMLDSSIPDYGPVNW